ncbi:MAG: alpha/beta fold hydrolase [Planctomycetaceae bacterium]|nr:alpha/beta fold hydrolase [Planctomycetaceae bacterium]MBT6156085.1 alpha/beta fold hydrolase [Planctomycetaceae bacterium]MBT6485134.1 alpha/beta fold hydrolase [Planctomycetaceae bacterium]MBT6494724.1 alpha/beta fold hydrolase [Planctomycetaceae bacterium]
MGWIVGGLLVALFIIEFILHGLYGAIMLRSFVRKLPFNVEAHPQNPDAERIEFPTTNGLTLRGSLRRQVDGPSRGLIIFCPELGGEHWSADWYASSLLKDGFDLLAFDFRNQGESDAAKRYDPLHWLTEFEVEDVLAAIAYSQTRDDLKELPVGLLGISRGGSAALAAATRCPEIQCVATEGAFSTRGLFMHFTLRWAVLYAPEWLMRILPTWHLKWTSAMVRRVAEFQRRCRYTRLQRSLPRLANTPTLLIAGQRDSYVTPEITRQMCEYIGDGPHEMWLVARAKHNMARHVDSDVYDAKLSAFFSQMAVDTVRQEVIRQTDAV